MSCVDINYYKNRVKIAYALVSSINKNSFDIIPSRNIVWRQ